VHRRARSVRAREEPEPADAAVEELLVLPIAVPGLATRPGAHPHLRRLAEFRASWLFILVGHVLFTLPFMVRSVLAVMTTIDLNTLEEGRRASAPRSGSASSGSSCPTCAPGSWRGH
jgi:putative spermidine/putrescine transport system permease protein